MSKVFVSYQHDEGDRVFRIVDILEKETGADVWIDRKGIFVGDRFAAVIESAIEDADFFVMMVSRKWFESDYCNMEFALAGALKKKLFPIFLEDCEIPKGQGYALAFSRVHYISAWAMTDGELAVSFRSSELVDRYQRGVELYMEGKFGDAVKFFALAAETDNNPEAQFDLGLCYMHGDGVEKNREEGVRWIRMAADPGGETPGLPQAQRVLGQCYEIGEGVSQDEAEAFRWYLKAAEDGRDMWALFLAGKCYDEGRGVDIDKQEAFRWYGQAADRGIPQAIYLAGKCYDMGNGVPLDKEKAAELFRRAADLGVVEAVNAYGVSLFFGEGIAQDQAEAVKYYRRAAEKKNTNAQYNLATCYEHGTGVKADPVEAFVWYSKAAKSGDPDAQFSVGIRYYFGTGVKRDEGRGLDWLHKAEKNGSAQAARFLKRLRKPAETEGE